MSSNTGTREFNMSDSDLYMFVSNLVNDMTRDVSFFGAFGITTLKITNLETLNNAFVALPTDPELEGLVNLATNDKNVKATVLK